MTIGNLRRTAIFAVIVLGLTCHQKASAAEKALKLDPTDTYGIAVIELQPPPAGFFNRLKYSSYNVIMREYDPVDSKVVISFSSADIIANSQPNQTGPIFVSRRAKAGFYLFERASIAYWGTCFDRSSQYFEVKPGEVTFIGSFNPTANLADILLGLQNNQIRGTVTTNCGPGGNVCSSKGEVITQVSSLELSQQGDKSDWEHRVGNFLKSTSPKVNAPIKMASLRAVQLQAQDGKACVPWKFKMR